MNLKEEHNFRRRHLVFIDLETTGLDREKHEIVELGCLRVNGENFEIIEEYSAKVKPTHMETADSKALEINGYSKEKWKEAEDLKDVLEKVAVMAEGGMIAGWNVSFDWAFIEDGFRRFNIKSKFNYHKVDVQSIAYAVLYNDPEVKNLRMREVALHFGIKLGDVHSATEDIKITYDLFKKLMAEYVKKN